MDPDDETPNPPERADVVPDVQPVTTHAWLENGNAPSSWAPPPPSGAAPPPPPPPRRADAPSPPPPPPALVVAPLPVVPPPPVAASFTPVPARPMSGYDAPAPESRWHTSLQHGELPPQASTARPRATVAAITLLAGAGLAALGSVMTWATFPDAVVVPGVPRTFNGFTELVGESKDGPFFAGFAAILAAFGVTLLLARRVTALLLLGAILAGFGAVAAVIDLLDVADPDGVPAALQPSVGVGLPVVVGGFVLALAGSLFGLVSGRSAR